LTSYLEGGISLSELQEALYGYIAINFDLAPDQRDIHDIHLSEDIKVTVVKEHLCQMIRKYLSGGISEIEFSNWAAFIFMTPFYVPEGETEEERWQAGEGPTWEVIQQLASPSIYGELNPVTAEEYLILLSCNLY